MPQLLLTGGFNGCGYTAKVHPSTGETKAWILRFVNTQLFERVERRFCPREGKLGRKKRVILVLDGAGWHLSESVKIPLGIHLYCLPSHSPELQPAERLWPADK
jgi:hypothetical protein